MCIKHIVKLKKLYLQKYIIIKHLMIKKGSKLYSILKNKCPRCHVGDFFTYSNPFKLKGNLRIHEHCTNCQLKYMIEPSFFYGAMYVSYGITVAIAIAVFIICQLFKLNLLASVFIIIGVLILFLPNLVRISRLIYINLFIGFENDKAPYNLKGRK